VLSIAVLMLAASAQASLSSRHLDRVPEDLLREALALDTLVSWSSKCFGIGAEALRAANDPQVLREYLENLERALLKGNNTAVIAVGGLHIRALRFLLYGSNEMTPEILEELIKVSISSLITTGVRYQDIEELVQNPSLASLARIYERVSRDPAIGKCLKDVLIKLLSFGVYLERGDVARARAVAEEVLSEKSVFFGVSMLSMVEGRTYVVRQARPVEISDEDLEKLVSKLRDMDIDLDEALSKYSLSELVELYESLKVIGNVSVQPGINGSMIGTGQETESADDALRQGTVSARVNQEESGLTPESYATPDPGKISELVSRIPPKVIASAVSVVVSTGYSKAYPQASGKTASPTYLNTRRQEQPSSVEIMGFVFVVIAAVVAIPITLRGVFRREVLEPLVAPSVRVPPAVTELSAAVRVFWEVVRDLSARARVEIRPSDTHREITRKLSSELDSVSSALLGRLSRLYEVARFSREVSEELIGRDLKKVEEMLKKLVRG